jgi:hypothetical protein
VVGLACVHGALKVVPTGHTSTPPSDSSMAQSAEADARRVHSGGAMADAKRTSSTGARPDDTVKGFRQCRCVDRLRTRRISGIAKLRPTGTLRTDSRTK